MARDRRLLINGEWLDGGDRDRLEVQNPATGETLGDLPIATQVDVAAAIAAASRSFPLWRSVSAFERGAMLHRAASLMRDRSEAIATAITHEEGKPFREAKAEVANTADCVDWAAEEGRRLYGRIIPSRDPSVRQFVQPDPVGPVAAFSPWNAPALLCARKIVEALAAGCTVVIKPAEETPTPSIMIAEALVDAGLPAGVLNMLFGNPAAISSQLIAAPEIRKISFTGSIPVGRQLAALAGTHLKRISLELGGHAPVIICEDTDIDKAATFTLAAKLRNAGQACVSPTRILVQAPVHDHFLASLSKAAGDVVMGNGMDDRAMIGPVANARRIAAMEMIVDDARKGGAQICAGGEQGGDGTGHFWRPTILADLAPDAHIMRNEPFGPIAAVVPFAHIEDAITMANQLPFGLAAYAFTNSEANRRAIAAQIECGVLGINSFAINLPETPFGGVKDSGYGSEGGAEGLSAYVVSKFIVEGQPG